MKYLAHDRYLNVLPKGRALSTGELRAPLDTCRQDKTAAGVRDGALIATLYGAGLRRAEAVALEPRLSRWK